MSAALVRMALVGVTLWCAGTEPAFARYRRRQPQTDPTTVSVTQDGAALAGAWVVGSTQGSRGFGRTRFTDTDGNATFRYPADRTVSFAVRRNGFTFAGESVVTPAETSIALPSDSALTFIPHREPVRRALVRVLSPAGKRYRAFGLTDADGSVNFTLPEGLEFICEVRKRGKTVRTPVYTAPAQIVFDPFNTAPVASDVAVEVTSGSVVDVTLAATDAEDDVLSYTVVSPPANGTLDGTPPALTYTPAPGFHGTDTFTYTAGDGLAESDPATATVTVTAPFIVTVTADDGRFTLPLKPGLDYNFTATYDGQTTTHTGDASPTLAFPSGPGTYDIAISGAFPAIDCGAGGDRNKIVDVKQWGSIAWETMESAFSNCINLQVSATDTPDFSRVTCMDNMFWKCQAMTAIDVSGWDVSQVTSMVQMFRGCSGSSINERQIFASQDVLC